MHHETTRRGFIQASALAGAATLVGAARAAEEKPATIIVALVGAAHIHVPGFIGILKSRDDVKVKCVYDHDAARAAQRANDLSASVAKTAQEIWDDPEIKAVVICSETNRHFDLVLAAAKASKHMFAEKPLGITGKESSEMADAIDKAKVFFTTGYMSRTSPQILFIKEQVDKGAFGKITRVRGSMCHDGSLGRWFDTDWRWMADPKVAGVGGFGDLGTHSLDILMWLAGDVESVAADIKVVTGNYGDCDESGEALIKFRNGITGTLAAGWVDLANPVTLMVSGTEAHAAIINDQLYFRAKKVEGADGRTPWKKLPARLPHPLEMFLNAVAGKEPRALVTPGEAAARVAVMEAMYQASKQKKWVTVG